MQCPYAINSTPEDSGDSPVRRIDAILEQLHLQSPSQSLDSMFIRPFNLTHKFLLVRIHGDRLAITVVSKELQAHEMTY
jgi:hypothetical protein